MPEKRSVNLQKGYARWDSERGYLTIGGPSVHNDKNTTVALWPSDVDRLGTWLSDFDMETPYFIYYRRRYRDHIVRDGDTICSHNVNVPGPASDQLKPFPQVTDREWASLKTGDWGDLCSQCRSQVRRQDLLPKGEPEEVPPFPCPVCGEPVGGVSEVMGSGYAEHDDKPNHEFDMTVFHEWRKGGKIETVDE